MGAEASPTRECGGELLLVGLGLSERMITLEAVEALSSADRVFLETYTSPGAERALAFLKKLRGGIGVDVVSRRDLEDLSAKPIMEALIRGERVALAVYGDPLVATTHNAIRLAAFELGCRVRYIPGVSVYHYAASLTGLSCYKFGPSVTVVYPRWGIKPLSSYIVISENLERGLHTFVFLDVDEELGPMTPDAAARILLEASRELGSGGLSESTLIVVLERLGDPQERVYCAKLGEVVEGAWESPPYSIIVPGRLHFVERDVLKTVGQGCEKLLQ